LDDSDELPSACPKCQQPLPRHEDLCDHCGYHRILKRCIDISDGVHKPDKSTGFERLFRGQLHDADSAAGTLKLMKIVGAFLALVFLFVCHPWSWLVAIGGVIAFLVWRRQRHQLRPASADSAVNQDVVSSLAWSAMLGLQRTLGWRASQWPFAPTRALTLHDPTFTDAHLLQLDGLHDFQTLDLEGTQISNDGLLRLEQMKQLRYLVFRRTNVTAAGAQRLQSALPNAWIWF